MFRKIVLIFSILVTSTAFAAESPSQVVHKFVDAYNAKDIDGMMSLATDNLVWLYVVQNSLQEMTSGKEQMKAELLKDFETKKGGRSEIRKMFRLADTVAVIEEAFWQKDGQTKSQCAISIYQFDKTLIKSVTYYDSAPCETID